MALSAALGIALVGAALYARYLHRGPELEVWHRAPLKDEFTAGRADEVGTLAGYFALEDRLFAELDREVYARVEPKDQVPYIRYARGSRSDPHRWSHDWNRSFELGPSDGAVGTALLLHGLSDSPYSMRSIGLHLASRGYHVVGLRLPGHGTAPAGMLHFRVEDMRAAVQLAVRDLARRSPAGTPLLLVGYSNGAALAVDYALRQRAEPKTGPRPSGLVLISPAIAVSRFAALGRIRTGLSSVPGYERAAWQQIDLEFDPFKYNSFSFNAAGQIQRLTSGMSRDIARLAGSRGLDDFPPVLAFISTVDATVHVDAVVDALLGHLAPHGHELVLFDVNRNANVQPLLVRDPGPLTGRLLAMPTRPFALTVITNVDAGTMRVHELRSAAGGGTPSVRPLDLAWPIGVSSLSHVSLPFPPDDPLYGSEPAGEQGTLRLGRVEVRGENGVLAIPAWLLLRQRSNPFHSYMLERIDEFSARVQRSSAPAAIPAPAPAPAGTRPST
jgi:alpha-beta hydrolase superfamily lysophospholipase